MIVRDVPVPRARPFERFHAQCSTRNCLPCCLHGAPRSPARLYQTKDVSLRLSAVSQSAPVPPFLVPKVLSGFTGSCRKSKHAANALLGCRESSNTSQITDWYPQMVSGKPGRMGVSELSRTGGVVVSQGQTLRLRLTPTQTLRTRWPVHESGHRSGKRHVQAGR